MSNQTKVEDPKTEQDPPVKKFTLMGAVEVFLNGDIWDMSPADINSARSTVKTFKDQIKVCTDRFDETLKKARDINGEDHLKGVEFFRNPRTTGKKEVDTLGEIAKLLG